MPCGSDKIVNDFPLYVYVKHVTPFVPDAII